ncbi:MAG: hypothetical protein ABI723_16230 [Bacteroidia bacterium]
MTRKSKISMTICVALIATATAFTSCKKENDAHTPPTVVFKTTAGYLSANDTVSMSDTLLVGIIADKTEDDMKTFNVSYAYDGAATTTTKDNFTLTTAEENHYEKDYTIITRNVAGSERWVFTITDRDGNITSLTITLTVI